MIDCFEIPFRERGLRGCRWASFEGPGPVSFWNPSLHPAILTNHKYRKNEIKIIIRRDFFNFKNRFLFLFINLFMYDSYLKNITWISSSTNSRHRPCSTARPGNSTPIQHNEKKLTKLIIWKIFCYLFFGKKYCMTVPIGFLMAEGWNPPDWTGTALGTTPFPVAVRRFVTSTYNKEKLIKMNKNEYSWNENIKKIVIKRKKK